MYTPPRFRSCWRFRNTGKCIVFCCRRAADIRFAVHGSYSRLPILQSLFAAIFTHILHYQSEVYPLTGVNFTSWRYLFNLNPVCWLFRRENQLEFALFLQHVQIVRHVYNVQFRAWVVGLMGGDPNVFFLTSNLIGLLT